MDHTELRRTGKFLLFSCSAGLIELGSFALFNEAFHWPYWGGVPDGACAVGAVELHVQPALYLPLDGEGGAGHGARVFVLLRVHAAVYAARAPARGRAGVEWLSRDVFEHGTEFRDGVSLPALRGLPQLAGHEQIRALKRKRSRCVRERFPIRSRFSVRFPRPAA